MNRWQTIAQTDDGLRTETYIQASQDVVQLILRMMRPRSINWNCLKSKLPYNMNQVNEQVYINIHVVTNIRVNMSIIIQCDTWQYNGIVKLRICPKYLSNPNQMNTNRRYDSQWYDFRITSLWFDMSYSYSITQGITSVMIPLDLITSRLCQSDRFFYSRALFPLINWLWIMAVIWNVYTVTTVREGKKTHSLS